MCAQAVASMYVRTSSSRKITEGAASLAAANTLCSARSLSPWYLLSTEDGATLKNAAPASPAAASASVVLPVPGGPSTFIVMMIEVVVAVAVSVLVLQFHKQELVRDHHCAAHVTTYSAASAADQHQQQTA
jgi:hypothetical protein